MPHLPAVPATGAQLELLYVYAPALALSALAVSLGTAEAARPVLATTDSFPLSGSTVSRLEELSAQLLFFDLTPHLLVCRKGVQDVVLLKQPGLAAPLPCRPSSLPRSPLRLPARPGTPPGREARSSSPRAPLLQPGRSSCRRRHGHALAS